MGSFNRHPKTDTHSLPPLLPLSLTLPPHHPHFFSPLCHDHCTAVRQHVLAVCTRCPRNAAARRGEEGVERSRKILTIVRETGCRRRERVNNQSTAHLPRFATARRASRILTTLLCLKDMYVCCFSSNVVIVLLLYVLYNKVEICKQH